jgi:hypothetical protein
MTQVVKATPQVFDALRKAGLVVSIPASAETPWETWGYDTNSKEGFVIFTLVEGERIAYGKLPTDDKN